MKTRRHLFGPLLIIAVGVMLILQAQAVFPAAVADIISRAWPALLMLVGLALLLEQVPSVQRFAPLLTVLLVAGIVAVVAFSAYATRANTERDDNTVLVTEAVDDAVTQLHVIINGETTVVEISPALSEDSVPGIMAEFAGSPNSTIEQDYVVDENGLATFTFVEALPDDLPMLEDVGRGRMRIELPTHLPVTLDFTNAAGTTSLNLLGLNVAQLTAVVQQGDLLLSLPNTSLEIPGSVTVQSGDLTVFVPNDLGVQFTTGGKTPAFGDGTYLLDPSTDLYVMRNYDSFDAQTELNIHMGAGSIRME